MKSMAISEFKAHALAVINTVSKTKQGLIITKRGKPVVQVLPIQELKNEHAPGKLAHHLIYEKDIVSPLGEQDWESAQ
jgi:prevent-host-death family protein